jgi:hypothetical protein
MAIASTLPLEWGFVSVDPPRKFESTWIFTCANRRPTQHLPVTEKV